MAPIAAADGGMLLVVPGQIANGIQDIDVVSSRSCSRESKRDEGSRSPRSPRRRRKEKEQLQGPVVIQELDRIHHEHMHETDRERQRVEQNVSLKQAGRRPSKSPSLEQLKSEGRTFKVWCFHLLNSSWFDASIGVVILLNSISIGLESTAELNDWDLTAFKVTEHIFLAIYTGELMLRFYVMGCSCLQSGWVRFDLVLVGFGIFTSWIMTPIVELVAMLNQNNDSAASPKEMFAPFMVLRVLRLFRLVRAVRLLVQFKTLWMLVRGLLSSASTILYTFLLISLMLYITACLAVEMITKPYRDTTDEVMAELVSTYWSDIPNIMLTLVQFVTFDSIGAIYSPMIARDPMLMILFLPFLLIVSISLMNLVTAVIVEGAIDQGKQDRDVMAVHKKQQIKAMIPALTAMFQELDDDGSGTLTVDELTSCDEELKAELMKYMNAESLVELFEMIDVDGSGEVNIDEFCDGISKLASSDTPVEFVRILKQLAGVKQQQTRMEETMKDKLASVAHAQERMEERLARIEQALLRSLPSGSGR
eukprot:gb/GFBE01054588.1/.p1 GENE.gb/GFBE01054588.1/~~gb/GFBE01054588.1/.p1  ORF type:complete len:535 (+),score=120.48 gb/GFBE01054588.1/:1-1605(+)